MPSIAQTPPGRVGNKKRRRDNDEGLQMASGVSVQVHFAHQNEELGIEMGSGKEAQAHWRPIAGRPVRQPAKRARVSSALYDNGRLDDVSNNPRYAGMRHGYGHATSVGDGNGDVLKEKKIDLRPCHICRRRPSDRAQLDRYADCEGCGARTCFVCMRQCDAEFVLEDGLELDVEGDFDCLASSFERREERSGNQFERGDGFKSDDGGGIEGHEDGKGIWEKERVLGHRTKVCRDCCVELGAEGEVRCLGCYRVDEP